MRRRRSSLTLLELLRRSSGDIELRSSSSDEELSSSSAAPAGISPEGMDTSNKIHVADDQTTQREGGEHINYL